jgi:hypothetical protein
VSLVCYRCHGFRLAANKQPQIVLTVWGNKVYKVYGALFWTTTFANRWHHHPHPTAAGYYCSWQTIITRDNGGFDGHVPRGVVGRRPGPGADSRLADTTKNLGAWESCSRPLHKPPDRPRTSSLTSSSLLYSLPPPCVGYSPATGMRLCFTIVLQSQLPPAMTSEKVTDISTAILMFKSSSRRRSRWARRECPSHTLSLQTY